MTTDDNKELGLSLITGVLSSTKYRFLTSVATARESKTKDPSTAIVQEYCEQLGQLYRKTTEHRGRIRSTITGKRAGKRDDMAISCLLNEYWKAAYIDQQKAERLAMLSAQRFSSQ
jgi:hypothetical protein